MPFPVKALFSLFVLLFLFGCTSGPDYSNLAPVKEWFNENPNGELRAAQMSGAAFQQIPGIENECNVAVPDKVTIVTLKNDRGEVELLVYLDAATNEVLCTIDKTRGTVTPAGEGAQADQVVVTGKVYFLLADEPPLDLNALDEFEVTLSVIEVHAEDGTWIPVTSSGGTFDLLALTDIRALLGEIELPPGNYDQLRFKITNAVAHSISGEVNVAVPANHIVMDILLTVRANVDYTVEIDFDLAESLQGTAAFPVSAPVIEAEVEEDVDIETALDAQQVVRVDATRQGNITYKSEAHFDSLGDLEDQTKLLKADLRSLQHDLEITRIRNITIEDDTVHVTGTGEQENTQVVAQVNHESGDIIERSVTTVDEHGENVPFLVSRGGHCIFSSECVSGLECVNNVCALPPPELIPCTTSSHCDSDEVCRNSVCAPLDDPCEDVACPANNHCVDGTCVLNSCSTMGGLICSSGTLCSESTVEAGDTSACCLGTCHIEEQSCSELGGNICAAGKTCSIGVTSANNTDACCLGTCETDADDLSVCKEIGDITEALFIDGDEDSRYISKTINYELNNANGTQTALEKVFITPESVRTTTSSNLRAKIDDADRYTYVLELSEGLPLYASKSGSGTPNFQDGDDDYVEVPITGTDYFLIESRGTLLHPQLILSETETATTRLLAGDKVVGLNGINDFSGYGDLVVEFIGAYTDAEGETFAKFRVSYDNEALLGSVDVGERGLLNYVLYYSDKRAMGDFFFVGTIVDDTSNADVDWVRIRTAGDSLHLIDGHPFPGGPTDSFVRLIKGNSSALGDTITRIEIYNGNICSPFSNLCSGVSCGTNASCVDGICILNSCIEMNGNNCSLGFSCSEPLVRAGDTHACCLASCTKDLEPLTCAEMDGLLCQRGEHCTAPTVETNDLTACCLEACMEYEYQNACGYYDVLTPLATPPSGLNGINDYNGQANLTIQLVDVYTSCSAGGGCSTDDPATGAFEILDSGGNFIDGADVTEGVNLSERFKIQGNFVISDNITVDKLFDDPSHPDVDYADVTLNGYTMRMYQGTNFPCYLS